MGICHFGFLNFLINFALREVLCLSLVKRVSLLSFIQLGLLSKRVIFMLQQLSMMIKFAMGMISSSSSLLLLIYILKPLFELLLTLWTQVSYALIRFPVFLSGLFNICDSFVHLSLQLRCPIMTVSSFLFREMHAG